MQVATPLFMPGDTLTLHPDFAFRGTILRDMPIGASHTIRPPASWAVTFLEQPITYEDLVQKTHCKGITIDQLRILLAFLNNLGALECRRTHTLTNIPGARWIAHIRLWHLGAMPTALTRRRSADTFTILTACLWATLPVLIAGAGSCLLLYATGSVDNAFNCLASYVILSGIFVGSLVLHEYTHWVVLRQHTTGVVSLHAGLRLGLVHAKVPARIELISALAGPVAGVFLCLLAAGTLWLWSLHLLAGIAGFLSVYHLLSLLPVYGDGRSILRLLRERSHA